jgi:hypothetical protein
MKSKFPLIFAGVVVTMWLASTAAQAQIFVYDASLSGPAEFPPNASPGTGFAEVTVNLGNDMLRIQVNFSGLQGTTTAAHIHAPTTDPGTGTAGVATQTPYFTGFPIDVTSGSYDNTFDMTLDSTWNPSYITANGGTAAGAEAAFVQALADGKAYFNIHTTSVPGGEIRGFLLPVPEPTTLGLIAVGGIVLLVAARRARRS